LSPDGKTTNRDAYLSQWRQRGVRPEALDVPPMPMVFERQFGLWAALSAWRGTGLAGPRSFEWPDFAAFTTVTRERLSLGDLAILHVIEEEHAASARAAEERRDRERPGERR